MPNIEFFNEDCMSVMARYPDNYFNLACVDPPLVGKFGGKAEKTNKSRVKLAIAKDYKPFAGDDLSPPNKQYFIELQRVSKKSDSLGGQSLYAKYWAGL